MGRLRIDRLSPPPVPVLRGEVTVVGRCYSARTHRARLVGLLATPNLAPDEGLWLEPCSTVHSIGMRIALTVAFLADDGRVLRIVDLPPWRGASCRGARTVVEVARGGLADVAVGDVLRLDSTK